MKKFLYICFLFWVNSVFLMAQEKKESGQSSLYTDQYITDIYMSEPDRALQLLDEAEKKKVMMPARINDLRSMAIVIDISANWLFVMHGELMFRIPLLVIVLNICLR